MTLTFYLCSHRPEYLNSRFEKLFNEAGIIIVEQASNDMTTKIENSYRKLSIGKTNPDIFYYPRYRDFNIKLESYLYGSRKEIFIERSPFDYSETHEYDFLIDKFLFEFFFGKPEEAYKTCSKYYNHEAIKSKERDTKLVDLITSIVKRYLEDDILVLRGALHTYPCHKLNGQMIFPYEPYIFPLSSEIIRRHYFGKEVDNEMIVTSIPETILRRYYILKGFSHRDSILKSRRIVERLELKDIDRLSLKLSKTHRSSYISLIEALRNDFGIEV